MKQSTSKTALGKSTTAKLPSQELGKLLATLEDANRLREYRKIDFFRPYVKQQEFMDLGMTKRERLLLAGNQLGKTETGAAETAYHLTGEYPDDWMGRRFDKPTKGWAAGETSSLVRDIQQKKLCGEPGDEEAFGTGMIPRDKFVGKPSLARGITDAYDTVLVRHKSGGTSVLKFKSYEQGRKKFQAATLDFVWCDEEPPMDIYSECLTRITATQGIIYVTFTPLQGRSTVVNRYLDEPSSDRAVVMMTIEDALHLSPEERAVIIAGYPPHEREARAKGIPMLGSGRIFPYSDESISEPAIIDVPASWSKIWGIDFGIDHPFAAALLLWDRDKDVIHVHHCFQVSDQGALQHSVPMKLVGHAVPVAWPQDGTQREKGSGDEVSAIYRKHGLAMLPHHATWPEGGVSTETGVLEMQERMTTGRFKVAAHLSQFFEQYHLYHRKDGLIVKMKDDILSAVRIGIMMKRFSRAVPLGNKALRRPTSMFATGIDFDLS